MKTTEFSIHPTRLQIRRESLILGTELKAIKISIEQGHEFKALTSFDELLAKYGYDNHLKEGESYQGYLAIDVGGRQEVVYLKGMLTKVPFRNFHSLDYNMLKACADGKLWQVTSDANNLEGHFNYVWTFRDCNFNRVIDELENTGKINEGLSSKDIQDKIIKALNKHTNFELTDDEIVVLRCYLGDYFRKFFVEL